jgi:hypothetical protein
VVGDVSGAAPLASPALTGNVTITSNSTGAALFIEQSGTGNILTLHDQAADTTFVAIDQNGKVNTIPSVAASAGFNVPHGAAPTSPVNGDIWTTTSGLFMRQNGSTQQYVDLAGSQTINGVKTFSNANLTFGNATGNGTLNVGTGAVISGSTKAVNIGTGGVAGSTTNITVGPALGNSTTSIGGTTAASTLNLATGNLASGLTKAINIGTGSVSGSTTTIAIGSNFGTSTTITGTLTATGQDVTLGNSSSASTINVGTGATFTATTKTVNIGTSGSAGSTTNIAIGSTTGTSTTTLQGITNGVTQSAGDSSLKLATTAFVTTADNLKANIASPALTGVPTAPTATLGTNTTQIATTAFVLANAPAAPVTSVAGRTGAVTLAVADVSGAAPLASPTFTGTPSLPTGTTAVTQTAGNNTTAVATTAFVTAAVPAFATPAQARAFTSTTTAMSPRQVLWSMLTPDVNNVSGQAMTTTNVGTIAFVQNGMLTRWVRPGTAGACSSRTRSFGPSQVDQVIPATSRTSPFQNIGFSERIILSGRSIVGGVNEANLTVSIYIGKNESDAVGDLTRRGIGWKMTGGAGSRFLLLQAHNGTTLSSVTSSYAVPDGVAFDWDVESDGAGNVTLYVNGSSVATSTGGPTGNSSGNLSFWNEEISASAALTSQFCAFINSRSKFAVINSW